VGTIANDALGSQQSFCSECGRRYPPEELVRFGHNVVCAECKPRFVQRIQEGAQTAGAVAYGGFWRRVLALLIDGIILAVVLVPVNMIFALLIGTSTPVTPDGKFNPAQMGMFFGYLGLIWLFGFALQLAYEAYFVSQKWATPGKMVLGMKVVTATGDRLSVGRAVGRFFGRWLSSLTLCIGYLIAAFDSQKRALHDHVCGTRVIR
jgi:uncharacterized RDD family membrane protein YckC